MRTPGYQCGHFLLFISTENKSFHFRVTADTEQRFITADPCLKDFKESCLWQSPQLKGEKVSGEVFPLCCTSGAVQALMLKNKDVETRRGKNSPVVIPVRKKSS